MKKITKRILNAGLAGLITLGGVGAYGQDSPKNEEKTSFAGVNVTTAFRDSYTAPVGFKIRRLNSEGDYEGGPVNQTMATSGVNNLLRKGDNLSAFTWIDYDFGYEKQGKGAFDEQDFGICYSLPLGRVLKGDLSASVGAQYWKYWSGNLGEHDFVTDINLTWAGPVTIDVQGRQLWPHHNTEDGRYVILQVSKPFFLNEFIGLKPDSKWSFAVIPQLSTAWNNNFYNDGSKWMQVSGAGRLSATKGKTSISMGAGYMHNLDSGPIEKSHIIWDLTLSHTFK